MCSLQSMRRRVPEDFHTSDEGALKVPSLQFKFHDMKIR